ncbi:putative short chain dehydrogenase/reductase [Xylaria digitata]|nr:putative short chain dehydrogenase/reductase [Xylaria digitata]
MESNNISKKGQNAPNEIKYALVDNIKANISVLQIDVPNQDSIEAAESFETNVFRQLAVTETLGTLLRKSAKPYVVYVSSEQGSAALNMLAVCHRYNFANWGCKALAFNLGWDPKDPAIALVDVVLGKRDADIEKNGMVDLDGGLLPW